MKLANQVIFTAAAVVASAFIAPSFASGGTEGAARLVTAMRLDYSALLGMQLSAQRAAQNGRAKQKAADCIKSLPNSTFSQVFTKMFQEALTPKEISEATTFFEGALGKKYIAHGLTQLYQSVGVSSPEPLPQFSESELQNLNAFSRTSAGEKLLVKKITELPVNRQAVINKTQEVVRSCQNG